MVQAVESAKQVLDAELAKCKWIKLNKNIKLNFETERQYNSIRNGLISGKGVNGTIGVGSTTILKFLGKPPWIKIFILLEPQSFQAFLRKLLKS